MTRLPSAPARDTHPAVLRSAHLEARLPALRESLLRQRDFRREQLAQFRWNDRTGQDRGTPSAVRDVQVLVAAGARRALEDIELALARIPTGAYGRCRECAAEIPLSVLEAIPQTTTCLSCQRRHRRLTERAARPPGPEGRAGQSGQAAGRFSRNDAMPSWAPGVCDIAAITSAATA
ncbi:MAG: TraR/DksA family transcriptional regulator [Pseudonocardia sp.]|nr:TraR/DksA family transcriptional regulator [Pseudonocardia sp.]